MKAISLPVGLHDAEKTPSRSIVIFFDFFVFTSTIFSASEAPAFVARTILLPSGDHDNPGCSHFNSSKSTERLPFTSDCFFLPETASRR